MNNSRSFSAKLMDYLRKRSVFAILLIIIIFFAVLSEQFLTTNNLLTVALQTSMIALSAIGMTFAIITGGIDLSVGPIAALCGALAAGLAVRQGIGTYPAMVIGLLFGGVLGSVNAAMIVWGRIPPFVATLASMATARGLTLVYTQGRPIAGLDERFTFWGSGDVFGIPTPVIILAVVALIAHILLSRTAFGLHIYAVGGGEETSRLAGVPVRSVKFSAYVLSGLCASLTGVLLTARLWSAQPNTGVLLELDAIAAAVLGGASLAGGAGSITGTVAGAFIIGVLSNGLNLLECPHITSRLSKAWYSFLL